MTTIGVDGIGGVGGADGPQRPAATPEPDGAGASDGLGKADGLESPENLGDVFEPVPGPVMDHARLLGQIHEMGPPGASTGGAVERISEHGLESADEEMIQQVIDRLLEEGL